MSGIRLCSQAFSGMGCPRSRNAAGRCRPLFRLLSRRGTPEKLMEVIPASQGVIGPSGPGDGGEKMLPLLLTWEERELAFVRSVFLTCSEGAITPPTRSVAAKQRLREARRITRPKGDHLHQFLPAGSEAGAWKLALFLL